MLLLLSIAFKVNNVSKHQGRKILFLVKQVNNLISTYLHICLITQWSKYQAEIHYL